MAWRFENVKDIASGATAGARQFTSEQFGHIKAGATSMRHNYMNSLDDAYEAQFYDPKQRIKNIENLQFMPTALKNNKVPGIDAQSRSGDFLRGDRSVGNAIKKQAKDFGKVMKAAPIISGAMYGLSAFLTDDPTKSGGDRLYNQYKHAAALTADVISDFTLTTVAAGLAMTGPLGMMAGTAITAFNIAGGLMGVDAGSLVMRGMDYAEEEYERAKSGPKFNMTKNTSMALQRQIQNMHASGSNLGEMMHNQECLLKESEKELIRQKIEDHTIYDERDYKRWRNAVFKRDGHHCQFANCKFPTGRLNAHHIKMKYYFPELIYDIKNGITLCEYHHRYIHRQGSDRYIKRFEKIVRENIKNPKKKKKTKKLSKRSAKTKLKNNRKNKKKRVVRLVKPSRLVKKRRKRYDKV